MGVLTKVGCCGVVGVEKSKGVRVELRSKVVGRSRNAKTLGEVPENKFLGRRDSVDDVVKMKKLKNEQKEFSTKSNRKLHFGNNLWKKSNISKGSPVKPIKNIL